MANRPVNLDVLLPFAKHDIRPSMGVGALVWRYTVLVPTDETRAGSESVRRATNKDLDNLRAQFCEHFGGVTVFAPILGFGLRDPKDLASLEFNRHLPMVVYARPISASDRYFERLQQELQDALAQGGILIERHETFLFGGFNSETDRSLSDKREHKLISTTQ